MLDLASVLKLLHRLDGLLDGSVRVNSVQVFQSKGTLIRSHPLHKKRRTGRTVEIDAVGTEPLEGPLARVLGVLGRAVDLVASVRLRDETELGADEEPVSVKSRRRRVSSDKEGQGGK